MRRFFSQQTYFGKNRRLTFLFPQFLPLVGGQLEAQLNEDWLDSAGVWEGHRAWRCPVLSLFLPGLVTNSIFSVGFYTMIKAGCNSFPFLPTGLVQCFRNYNITRTLLFRLVLGRAGVVASNQILEGTDWYKKY